MKHQGQTLATYVYKYFNLCNIPIYFYNLRMKQHMQRPSKISETFELYICNMCRMPGVASTAVCIWTPVRRSRSRSRGQRSSAQGPDDSPRWWRPLASSGEAGGGAGPPAGAVRRARGAAARVAGVGGEEGAAAG